MITHQTVYNCDFCGVRIYPDTMRVFHAHDFEYREVAGTHLISAGAWVGCPDCGKLVETEQWQQLENKAIADLWKDMPDADLGWIRGEVQMMHRKFRASRFGTRQSGT